MRVRSLLGHAQLPTAIPCLGSFIEHSADPVTLVVHEDGSLTGDDAELLRSALPGVEILWRDEADERLASELASRPACRAFRDANPLGLKLLDVALLEEGDSLAFCDADVLFVRPFKGLFRCPEDGRGSRFMADSQNAYSLRSWHLVANRRLVLASSVNSGIISFHKSAWDLDLVEWFLSQPRLHRRTPVWAEQTAWALLAGAAGRCELYEPAQVHFPVVGPPPSRETVALHFISPLRDRLDSFLERLAPQDPQEPVRVGTAPTGRCGVLELLGSEVRRRLGAR